MRPISFTSSKPLTFTYNEAESLRYLAVIETVVNVAGALLQIVRRIGVRPTVATLRATRA